MSIKSFLETVNVNGSAVYRGKHVERTLERDAPRDGRPMSLLRPRARRWRE